MPHIEVTGQVNDIFCCAAPTSVKLSQFFEMSECLFPLPLPKCLTFMIYYCRGQAFLFYLFYYLLIFFYQIVLAFIFS